MMKRRVRQIMALVLALCMLTAIGCKHSHVWQEASCEEAFHCTTCGETSGEPLGHTWVEGAKCTDDTVCSTCGAVTANTGGTHTWVERNCENPKTCSTCGATEGEAQGHFWRSATCETPQTCDRCGATKGEARGHMPTKATCTQKSVCSICGSVRSLALGHQWEGATCTQGARCTVCGALGNKTEHTFPVGTLKCGERKMCTVCGYQEAPLAHQWNADGRCTRCHEIISVEQLQSLVSFQCGNFAAVKQDTGDQVYVRALWVSSSAAFNVTIQSDTLMATTSSRSWKFAPYHSVITPELGKKQSTLSWVGKQHSEAAVLNHAKTINGSYLICLVINDTTRAYTNCNFEMNVSVGSRNYQVIVGNSGVRWEVR